MESLKDLMDKELIKLRGNKYKSLEEFITDDQRSAKFISSMTDGFTFEMPDEKSKLYTVAQARARHSAVTFLMGLVFKRFGGLFKYFETVIDKQSDGIAFKLWLMTALNHDRAYTSIRLSDPTLDMEKVYKPYLFSETYKEVQLKPLDSFERDYPKVSAYSSVTIHSYDKYSRDYHTDQEKKYSDEPERIDHGILGGVILFQEMTSKYIKENKGDETELLIVKASSLTIAQHNMFRSPSKETDEKYILIGNLDKLLSTSDFRISDQTPLLLFLSLIDTVECVKRFSRESNKEGYLNTLTVLKSILVDVTEERIDLDFSVLRKEIQSRNNNVNSLLSVLDKQISAISCMEKWTMICTSTINDDLISLVMQPEKKQNLSNVTLSLQRSE